ncbi:MAG: hypothetical protein ABI168_07040 [Ginsengibacter sp.]
MKNKTTVIYGSGGAVGKAVAKIFTDEGAKVFLQAVKPGKIQTV